jgi:hypothetical protein
MTTRAAKATGGTKPAAATRKGNKLALSKKTLQDLTPGRAKGTAVRGGGCRTGNCTT